MSDKGKEQPERKPRFLPGQRLGKTVGLSHKRQRFFGHNFATVYRFEVVRALKKKTFWLSMLAFPLLIAGVYGLTFWAGSQSESTLADLAKEKFSIALTDDSGTISSEMIKQIDAHEIAKKEDGLAKVKTGETDAYFYYPQDLTKNRVEIYAKNVGIFENFKYQSVAQALLQNSALTETSPEIVAILTGQIDYDVQTYQDGENYNPMMEMIAPGVFLVLFFLIMVTFGGQMINAVVEEKENRVSEMILTTIRARTLIIGKIFAFLTMILIQVAVILSLVVIAYFALRNNLNLPSFDLSQIPLDWSRIAVSFTIFAASLLLFSGLLVAIGAAMPTAKEANNFFAVPILLIIGPLYVAPMMITDAANSAISFMTLFPFTAPLPLMLRNAVGNLSLGETIGGIAVLAVTAVIVFTVAARLFQTGAVEYSKKLSLKGLFK
ncbi:ABC transporter permease [Candidatus Saccharibacteria bacterium]|nr:ABC transporter permease [Candidatus Saccharibacteria bacterium]